MTGGKFYYEVEVIKHNSVVQMVRIVHSVSDTTQPIESVSDGRSNPSDMCASTLLNFRRGGSKRVARSLAKMKASVIRKTVGVLMERV